MCYVVLCIVMKMKMKSIDIEFDYDYVSEFRQGYLGNYTIPIPSHPLATSILTTNETRHKQFSVKEMEIKIVINKNQCRTCIAPHTQESRNVRTVTPSFPLKDQV